MPIRTLVAGCSLACLLLAPGARAAGPTLAGPTLAGPTLAGKDTPLKPLVSGLKNPQSVAIGPDRRVYVSVLGEPGKDGDGGLMVLQDGQAVPFATGMDDPRGLVAAGPFLYAADKTRVWRIDPKGRATVFVDARAFPKPPLLLHDIEADSQGNLYVTDAGDLQGGQGRVIRITAGGKVSILVGDANPALRTPRGLRMASEYHLHLLDFASGVLHLVRLIDGQTTPIAEGFAGGDGIAFDYHGRLYLSSRSEGKVHVFPRPDQDPVLLASGFQSAADLCLSADGKFILVADPKAGTLTALPTSVPGAAIDESPLPVSIVPAFAGLTWTGWGGETSSGKVEPLRPIVLTHAGDGSNRVFVGTQHGVVHVFANDPAVKKTKVFLDLRDRVTYQDNQNEEGFLGLAFHPGYRKNGEFFVYYTHKKKKPGSATFHNVVSRFKASKDDPDRADPASEEVLLELPKPFWNHDGGTLAFGPDGFLYVAVGDGGSANDPFNNGQNLGTLLGKVLRIDVNRKEGPRAYGIPGDNPFVARPRARGEVWAYGLRNIWRMSFDSRTGKLWAADVGQNLWEEINRIEKGGNYGWRPRESLHPFGIDGVGPNPGMVEPIWEYHHDVGKSITGGHVYRGTKVQALAGLYLYADYVSGHVWGLRYDERRKRVTANHLLRRGGFPVFSFGEDEKGEVYLLTGTPTGQGLFTFAANGG